MTKVWLEFEDIFKKKNIKNNIYQVLTFDECMFGHKTKQVLLGVKFEFFKKNIIISWNNPNYLFLLECLHLETNIMDFVVDNNYKVELTFNDIKFNELNNNIVEKIIDTKIGSINISINGDYGYIRSQILMIPVNEKLIPEDEDYYNNACLDNSINPL